MHDSKYPKCTLSADRRVLHLAYCEPTGLRVRKTRFQLGDPLGRGYWLTPCDSKPVYLYFAQQDKIRFFVFAILLEQCRQTMCQCRLSTDTVTFGYTTAQFGLLTRALDDLLGDTGIPSDQYSAVRAKLLFPIFGTIQQLSQQYPNGDCCPDPYIWYLYQYIRLAEPRTNYQYKKCNSLRLSEAKRKIFVDWFSHPLNIPITGELFSCKSTSDIP